MLTKIIGLTLLLSSGLLIYMNFEDMIPLFLSPPMRLQSKIQKDTVRLLSQTRRNAPPSIHHVEIKYRSKKAHDFLKNYQPEFKTSVRGTIWMEIEVIDLPDEENPGLITQVSIFDVKTNNKISEFAETYYFKNFSSK